MVVVRAFSLALPSGLGVASWLLTIHDHVRTGIICCALIGAVRCAVAIGHANTSQNIGTKQHVLRRKKKYRGPHCMNQQSAARGIPNPRHTRNTCQSSSSRSVVFLDLPVTCRQAGTCDRRNFGRYTRHVGLVRQKLDGHIKRLCRPWTKMLQPAMRFFLVSRMRIVRGGL